MPFPDALVENYNKYPLVKMFAEYIRPLFENAENGTPFKADIKPFEMKPFLSSIALYEVVNESFIKLRLVGTAVEPVFGSQSTGSNVLEILPQESKDAVSWFFQEVSRTRCATWQDEELVLNNGRIVHAVTLGIPLLCSEGKPIFRMSVTELSGHSWDINTGEREAKVTHRKINMLGYYDLGFGTPDQNKRTATMPQKVTPKYRESI